MGIFYSARNGCRKLRFCVPYIYGAAYERAYVRCVYAVFKRGGVFVYAHSVQKVGDTLHLTFFCPDVVCLTVVKRLADMYRKSAGSFHIGLTYFYFNYFARRRI